jgi:tripartite-type tricarboxylate transporter receptor subunit TctC
MASFLVAAAAAAQSYPNRPVKIVVSYPPGGVIDVLARPLAAGLQQEWGSNPVLVGNWPGENAIIGTDYVAKQPGDGHTGSKTATGRSRIASLPYALALATTAESLSRT